MYGVAEIVASRVPSPEAYIGVLPAIAIVPFFFAGSLFPITSLPSWLADVAKILPLTHALALFRYGLTPANGGAQALRSIWGMSNDTTMAALSMLVVGLYAAALMAGAVRLFTKQGTSWSHARHPGVARAGRRPGALPFVPGHEDAGTVSKVGPGVSGVTPGDLVAWAWPGVPSSYAERVARRKYRRLGGPDVPACEPRSPDRR